VHTSVRRLYGALAAVGLVASVLVAPSAASPAAAVPPPAEPIKPTPHADHVTEPDRVLGKNWRGRSDRAVTLSSDETGVHLLAAEHADAYRWRTVASLAEPGIETDQWIGRYCLTGSGRRAAVVYAPRQYANRPETMAAGGFVAIVDLRTGAVTKLAERTSLAYFNPTCGASEKVVISREEGTERKMRTWTGVVDARSAKVVRKTDSAGQITSQIPVGDRVLAAVSGGVAELGSDGRTKLLAATDGTPYRLTADGTGAVALQVNKGGQTRLQRLSGGRLTTIGVGELGTARLHGGPGGRVFVVGSAATDVMRTKKATWTPIDAGPDSDISSTGTLVVDVATTKSEAAAGTSGAAVDGHADPVTIEATVSGGPAVTFGVTPAENAAGLIRSPALGGPAAPQAALATDSSTVTYDPERTCAVPRNDPAVQVYQPTPKQVEWAADLAVKGQLNFARPANWNNDNLPSYYPQGSSGLFPLPAIKAPAGVTGAMPAQVLLGVLAQESNMRQASWHIVDGSSGNPLTAGGWYGADLAGDIGNIDFSKTDCGYGVGQITSGMRKSDTGTANGLSDLQQNAVVLDYATNVSASVRILAQKWNDAWTAGIIANGGNPNFIENWFFALWAYNSGMHPDVSGGTQPWGLGWLNNPANPHYPADRRPYLTAPLRSIPKPDTIAYDNAKHPSDWSYPERIMGWAHTSAILPDYSNNGVFTATYLKGVWPKDASGSEDFVAAQPSIGTFCTMVTNFCDRSLPAHQPTGEYATEPPGPCQKDDLTLCWWHGSANWVDCSQHCGVEALRYTASSARPLATSPYPAQCKLEGLPSNAVVVDDMGGAVQGPDNCRPTRTSNGATVPVGGALSWSFSSQTYAGQTVYPSKVDFHQAGAGYAGHFWFSHTRKTGSPFGITGKWTPSTRLNGWVQVMVHIPEEGAWTQQADYTINIGDNSTTPRHRYVNQDLRKNTWVQLGTYKFSGSGPQNVSLSNITRDGFGNDDVAWDAAAFVPLTAKPKDFVVAIGDSYASGEGVGNYYTGTDDDYLSYSWNACRRSKNAWPRSIKLHDSSSTVGAMADSFSSGIDFQFTACSGSTTTQMGATDAPSYWNSRPSMDTFHQPAPWANGQFSEQRQIESGALSEDTTLVLLSAGGNDANFSGVMQYCAVGTWNCTDREADWHENINVAQQNVQWLIKQIHNKARNATVALVGYPHLFAVDHGGCAGVYNAEEIDMLNRLSDYMANRARESVAALRTQDSTLKVGFIDMIPGLPGGACSAQGNPEHIIGISFDNTGPGDFQENPRNDDDNLPCPLRWSPISDLKCVSRTSFHPNAAGAADYASWVTSQLPEIGY
jgi:GDSL-like Lipase/Acylhydrolase